MFECLYIRRLLLSLTVASIVLPATTSALDDPTKPAFLQPKKRVVKKLAPLKTLTVNSILYSSQRKTVVINDSVLSIGEKIEDATILDIGRDFVVVKRRSGRVTMSITAGDDVKRRRVVVAPAVKERQ